MITSPVLDQPRAVHCLEFVMERTFHMDFRDFVMVTETTVPANAWASILVHTMFDIL